MFIFLLFLYYFNFKQKQYCFLLWYNTILRLLLKNVDFFFCLKKRNKIKKKKLNAYKYIRKRLIYCIILYLVKFRIYWKEKDNKIILYKNKIKKIPPKFLQVSSTEFSLVWEERYMPKWKTMDYKSGRSDVLFFFFFLVYSIKRVALEWTREMQIYCLIIFCLRYTFLFYMELNFTKQKKLKYFSDIWLRQTETLKTKGTFF